MGGIVNVVEECLDSVTVVLALANTAGGRTDKVFEAEVAMLMDTKRSVKMSVSCPAP
jgi:hypothetical protein